MLCNYSMVFRKHQVNKYQESFDLSQDLSCCSWQRQSDAFRNGCAVQSSSCTLNITGEHKVDCLHFCETRKINVRHTNYVTKQERDKDQPPPAVSQSSAFAQSFAPFATENQLSWVTQSLYINKSCWFRFKTCSQIQLAQKFVYVLPKPVRPPSYAVDV